MQNDSVTTSQKLLARRKRVLGAGYRLFYQEPLHVVRAEGVWLYDEQDRPYLDVYNNVASVGHCHPAVVAAIAEQSARLNTHTRYLNDAIVDFAEDFLQEFPAELGNITLTCSGSEANDLALRIARFATGGSGVLVARWAYHGVTAAVAEVSPALGDGAIRGPSTVLFDAPDSYRRGISLAESVAGALRDMRQRGIKPAALLADTIFSSDGIFCAPPGQLRQAAELVRQAGGLFIADEVQAGFGRTGNDMWGFTRHGVTPDMVTVGKPMGNGHPVAGLVGRPALFDVFGSSQRYFNTFGGNPVSARAAHAVLKIIREEKLAQNAARVGDYLAAGLRRLAARYSAIGDIRAYGLFIGVELVLDRQTREPASELAFQVVNLLRGRRILTSTTGPRANILKIRPPLVFQTEHADLLLEQLDRVLAQCHA
ncbi:aminotransferase class III-fold pyridoxal phosphate-dependent enzyme [Sodalis ligni]|uniref:aspartate aminotransferase family protein n=1 Tax=Sodalis ligni TaxID=2697027 RepID=UPI00193F7642|nr:aminotransferase class III-fold pyridoxal phosphate-dependent enzyme [Sodalis ligni]QWA13556.1 aminotransferase class III-fold pyridoxal phosphate-dependent enzyme [Sodalis ligni]